MICCKILFNHNHNDNFNQLLESLGQYGDLLWDQGVLYFGVVDSDINSVQIQSICKDCGYEQVLIDEYTKENQPTYESDYVKGWLNDHLLKISYIEYEKASQKAFHDIQKGLDILDQEIEHLASVKK